MCPRRRRRRRQGKLDLILRRSNMMTAEDLSDGSLRQRYLDQPWEGGTVGRLADGFLLAGLAWLDHGSRSCQYMLLNSLT